MLTSYHTSNFDSKTNNHLVTQYAPALFGYLFNCFEALLTPIKYSRQSVKWITFPMEVIENVLKSTMQQEGRVLKFPALSNFCAGYHFGMITVMGSFSSFIFYVFVTAPVSSVMSNADYWSVIPAERICKPGPPLTVTTGKMNCLIIGDSISIG